MRAALLASLLAATLATRAGASCVPVAVVPLADRAGYLTLRAAIGGVPVTLLLDTGATAGLVQADAARSLGMPAASDATVRMRGTGGSGATVPIVALPTLALGRLRIDGLRAPISALPQVPHVTPPVAGLLGADVLSHFQIEIDVPRGRLALYRAGDCGEGPGWRRNATEVALTRAGDRLFAAVRLDGVALRALLDTGARSIIVGARAAAAAGAVAAVLAREPGGIAGGTDLHPLLYHWHRFAALEVGPIALPEPTLTVMPIEEDAAVLLGAPFFATRRVWLRYDPPAMFVRDAMPPNAMQPGAVHHH